MLQHLSIKNYALIDQLEIDLTDGLTIITGETGAGKSILLGALGLILGQRADVQALQDKSVKCIIEGTFRIRSFLKPFFEKHQLDYDKSTIIRREINPEGKSRAFINDTPVNLNQLKELGTMLIDVHSQHETLTLNNSEFQLAVVDAYADHQDILQEYRQVYNDFKATTQQLQETIEREQAAQKEADYIRFQFEELEQAGLKTGEQESMEQELEMLNHAEDIKTNLLKAAHTLNDGDMNLLVSLNDIKSLISTYADYNNDIKSLSGRLNSAYIELKDIYNELEELGGNMAYDPARIEELDERLDNIYRLEQKHQVKDVDELIALKEELSQRLNAISSLESEVKALQKKADALEKSLQALSQKITAGRRKAAPRIEKDVRELLTQLAMPNARFKIELNATERFTATGTDKVNFLFAANKGSDLRALNKVASGGELSRLMLSIKSIISRLTELPAIIFDEIDTGISGDIAARAGGIMAKMGESMQVITITHLPQIAGQGSAHLLVYKEEKKDKTYTRIRVLKRNERVEEIARMLSAGQPTAAAMKNAKELLLTK